MPAGRFKTVTDPTAPVIPGKRPPPPDDLTAEQQAIWSSITGRLPADWFNAENYPLLRELARHVDYSNWLAGAIEKVRATAPDDLEGLRTLLRAHALQSERIAILSTKLKLTQRSRYTRDGEAAAIASRDAPKPWLDEDGKPYRKQ
jgi:hypothetical protein